MDDFETNKNALSFSKISTYLECPLKYKLKYIDKIKEEEKWFFNFGKSIHKTLEELYKIDFLNLSLRRKIKRSFFDEFLLPVFEKSWISKGYKNKQNEEKKKEEGKSILKTYYRSNIIGINRVKYVEKKFATNIEGIPFRGIIDRVDIASSGNIELIDYKTSSSKSNGFLKWNLLQLSLYEIAFKNLFDEKADRLTLYYLKDNKKITFSQREDLKNASLKIIFEVGNNIEKEKFKAKKGPHCLNCDYKNICLL